MLYYKPTSAEYQQAINDSFPPVSPIPSPILHISPAIEHRFSLGSVNGTPGNLLLKFHGHRYPQPPESPTKSYIRPGEILKLIRPITVPTPANEETIPVSSSATDGSAQPVEVNYSDLEDEDEEHEPVSRMLFQDNSVEERENSDVDAPHTTAPPTELDSEEEPDNAPSDDEYSPAYIFKSDHEEESSADEYVPTKNAQKDKVSKSQKGKGKLAMKPKVKTSKSMPRNASRAPMPPKTLKRRLSSASFSSSDEVDTKKLRIHTPLIEINASTSNDSANSSAIPTASNSVLAVWKFMPAGSPERALDVTRGIKLNPALIQAIKDHLSGGSEPLSAMKPTAKCPIVPQFERDTVEVPKAPGQKVTVMQGTNELYRVVRHFPILCLRALEQGHFDLLFHRTKVGGRGVLFRCPHCDGEMKPKSKMSDHFEYCAWLIERESEAAEANLSNV